MLGEDQVTSRDTHAGPLRPPPCALLPCALLPAPSSLLPSPCAPFPAVSLSYWHSLDEHTNVKDRKKPR